MARLFGEPVPADTAARKALLLGCGIALWDVVAVCDIKGSSEQSIRNVVPADINRILRAAEIQAVIANGDTAYRLYQKYCREYTGREAVKCPSTSPSNAIFTLERLADRWEEAVGKELLTAGGEGLVQDSLRQSPE